ncbi:MAG: translation initiation factor IF-1, partial [Candidatus Berkelbacteria bacterium Licking1014_2]
MTGVIGGVGIFGRISRWNKNGIKK